MHKQRLVSMLATGLHGSCWFRICHCAQSGGFGAGPGDDDGVVTLEAGEVVCWLRSGREGNWSRRSVSRPRGQRGLFKGGLEAGVSKALLGLGWVVVQPHIGERKDSIHGYPPPRVNPVRGET